MRREQSQRIFLDSGKSLLYIIAKKCNYPHRIRIAISERQRKNAALKDDKRCI